MNKESIITLVSHILRVGVRAEMETIIRCSPEEWLDKLRALLPGKRNLLDDNGSNKVCIELDFLAAKLYYFHYLPEGFKLKNFGVDLKDIPELVAKWRDEKINKTLE